MEIMQIKKITKSMCCLDSLDHIRAHFQRWETDYRISHSSKIPKLRQSKKLITCSVAMTKSMLDLNKKDFSTIMGLFTSVGTSCTYDSMTVAPYRQLHPKQT